MARRQRINRPSISRSSTRSATADGPIAQLEPLEPRVLFSAGTLDILALGDSITHGTNGSTYRQYLTSMLDSAGVDYDMLGTERDGSGFDNQHYGIPGGKASTTYTSSSGIYRPGTADALRRNLVLENGEKPDAILLHIGTNSINGGVSEMVNEFRSLLDQLARSWRDGDFAPNVQVFIAKIIPAGRGDNGSVNNDKIVRTDEYNDRMAGLINSMGDQSFANRINLVDMFKIDAGSLNKLSSSDRNKVDIDGDPYVDWFKNLNEANPQKTATDGNNAVMRDNDNYHPAPLGDKVMANVWFNALKSAGLLDGTGGSGGGDDGGSGGGDSGGGGGTGQTAGSAPGSGFVKVQGTGDFDGDGQNDLFWFNKSNGRNILQTVKDGKVTGQFEGEITGGNWRPVIITEMNGDGRADVIWRNPDTNKVAVRFMNGINFDNHRIDYQQNDNDDLTAVRDVDGDGNKDLVWNNGQYNWFVASNGHTVLSKGSTPGGSGGGGDTGGGSGGGGDSGGGDNSGGGTGQTAGTAPGSGFVKVQGTGDFDGDGQNDLFWFNQSNGKNILQLVKNGTVVSELNGVVTGGNWRPVLITELNKDGRADVIWRNTDTDKVAVRFMNGINFVNERIDYQRNDGHTITDVRDTNGDGNKDVVWNNGQYTWLLASNGHTVIAQGSGGGSTGGGSTGGGSTGGGSSSGGDSGGSTGGGTSGGDASPGSGFVQVQGAGQIDFNNDGQADRYWFQQSSGRSVMQLMNNGSVASTHEMTTLSPNWRPVFLGDVNNDGKTDVILRNPDTDKVGVRTLNGGTETGYERVGYQRVDSYTITDVRDTNGDGKNDIVFNNETWLMNGLNRTSVV